MDRIYPSFVDAFMEYTEGIPSPEIFRRWTAISTVAGALERRCWTRVTGSFLYPNLMVLLVAGPGIGKSMSINECKDLWAGTGQFNVAPASLTKAAFIDQLKMKMKNMQLGQGGPMVMYHALLVPSPEFGVLVTAHDLAFLNTMNDIYDCGKVFEERTRSGGTVTIDHPHMSLLGGTQPKYLHEVMPEQAWGMGFTSRIIMVYASQRVTVSLFSTLKRSQEYRASLISDLKDIAQMKGEFHWEADAAEEIDQWHMQGCPPIPAHIKLQNYVPRRTMHCMKLAMAFSASRSPDMVITLGDLLQARDLLLEAEALMPEIFKEMTSEPDAEILTEAYSWMVSQYQRNKQKPIRENMLTYWFAQKVPVQKINFMIETMINAGMIAVELNMPGARTFKPKQKNEIGYQE